jgi:signal transduction histidine kinase
LEELESIQKMLAFSFKNSGITLRFFTNTNSSIVGNPNEFIQVVLNILLNAQDQFNTGDHSNAVIEISTTEVNETCIITIQDNAGGVTIEPIEQIFDLHVSSKSAGAGIGLFICKSIIEKRFNGTIEVLNQHNGACFKIFIPLNVA